MLHYLQRWFTANAKPSVMPPAVDASRSLERAHEACVKEIHATFEGTMLALGQALELRDYETQGHTQRVVQLTSLLAASLKLPVAACRAYCWGAYLHDIGKLAIPDALLRKPGKLSAEEWQVMRRHPENGLRMLENVPALPIETLAIVRHHHERIDGAGYPDGLAGEAIPLAARAFAVVDVYDALSHTRPYKTAWPYQDVCAYLQQHSGTHFDAEVVAAFLQLPLLTVSKSVPESSPESMSENA